MSLTVSCVTPRATGLRCPALGGLNLKRRHLNDSQRAMVGNRLANLKEGRPEKTALIQAVSQSDAAEQMKVSRFSIQRAAVVQRDGAPELIAAVDAGQVSVSAAAEVATLPENEQREVVARGEKEILTRAKEIRAAKAVRDDYAAGMWAYALTGRQKVPVYKNGLYYTASKRYFRAPKTPRWGNLVL